MKNFKTNALAAAVMTACLSGQALAGETIEFDNGASFDWKATVNYSLGIRLEDAAPELASSGNFNFEKNDLIANGVSLLLETHYRKDNYGLVMSATGFYDDVYQGDEFSAEAEKYHGGYARLLDFYVYTSFSFGESGYADIRLGKHVVAWGEGLFFPSISLAQGPSDAIKATTPGAEIKDILLPEDQISMQLEITPDFSLLAHYQFNWHETTVPEPGTFWSTGETTGKGAFCVAPHPLAPGGCGFGLRGEDIEPGDNDQWGVGARYRLSENTEFGLFYLEYGDRIPLPDINPGSGAPYFIGSNYQIRYAEKVELVGATFTTTTGMNSFAGEVTYKDGAPVILGNGLGSPSTSTVLQTSVNAITNFGRSAIADNITVTTEISYVDIRDIDTRGIKDIPVAFVPGTNTPLWTNHGFALATSANFGYPGITENWDLGITVNYQNQLSGRTLTGGLSGSAAEGDQRAGLSALFTHPRTGVQVGINYAAYIGDFDATNVVKSSSNFDRDNLSLNVKYAF